MDFKKEIESLLLSLEKLGLDRDAIERNLHYSENYIDQQLSRGGNKRFVQSLKDLLQKTILGVKPSEVALPLGDLKITLKDHFDLMKEHTEYVKKHASIMERIVEARLLEGDINSGEAEKTTQFHPPKKGVSMFEERPFGDKSTTQGRRVARGNNPVKGK